MAYEGVEAEKLALKEELKWLLKDEAHSTLNSIEHTLKECCKCFPLPVHGVDEGRVSSHAAMEEDRMAYPSKRLLLSGTMSTTPGNMKCVITLRGDSICDADIKFKHKEKGKDSQSYRLTILPDKEWKLQQVQDAVNHLQQALVMVSDIRQDHVFSCPEELIMLLERLKKSIQACRLSLSIPKRRSLQDLVHSKSREVFNPPVPQNVALSFYIHGAKVILAVYMLHMNGQQRMDVSTRIQMETEVQWLTEVVVLFSVAMQQCQQLADKITMVCQCAGMDLKTKV